MYSHQYPQYWHERQYSHPMHHRHGRFHDPYEGRQNYWRDSWQDNYYHHPHHHRHHHRERDREMIPRFIEGILGKILDGELLRDLDIKIKSNESARDDDWKERAFQRASAQAHDFSPDEQLSMNLDFTPQQDKSGPEGNAARVERFGRTG